MSEGDWLGTIVLAWGCIILVAIGIKSCIRQYWQNKKDFEEGDLIK